MKAAKLSLLDLSVLTGAHSAIAKTPSPDSEIAVPLESPGDWISTSDYPATALRFEMTGITTFRLRVDPTGKPSHCDIVESSGFDLLDTATCQRLMAQAQFSPSHDRKGKAVEGAYSNRVRWVLPSGSRLPVSERFASMLLSIDQTWKLTSCRVEFHIPAETGTSAENPCKQALNSQLPALGMELRGSFQGPSADVEIQLGDVFTPALRAYPVSDARLWAALARYSSLHCKPRR
jgi:hypothetical protein